MSNAKTVVLKTDDAPVSAPVKAEVAGSEIADSFSQLMLRLREVAEGGGMGLVRQQLNTMMGQNVEADQALLASIVRLRNATEMIHSQALEIAVR